MDSCMLDFIYQVFVGYLKLMPNAGVSWSGDYL